MKTYKPREFITGEERYYECKDELQLAKELHKQSYFTLDENTGFKTYKIIFCVPTLDFEVYQIFTLNGEIWILISDKETTRAVGRGKKYILEINFDDDSLPNLDRIATNNTNITIKVFNDHRFVTKWNKSNSIDKEPQESGGGVIIVGP